jgi:WD40 repeat protein
VISAVNAPALAPAAKRNFSPWDQVLALAWSPDGDALAASAGENLYLLAIPELDPRLSIALDVCAPALDFSPDGFLLASGDRSGSLRTWSIASGELQSQIQAHQKPVSSVSYNPDGSILASAGYDAVARLWDSSSGAELSEMIGGTFAIPAIAFTPDGASIAIVNGGIIRLRDTASTRFVRTIAGEAPFFSIAFSPDGRLLASGDVANTIQLWDMSTQTSPAIEIRQSLLTLTGHAGRSGRPEALVWQVAFSPDGSLLASAGGDKTVRVWEVKSGRLLATLEGHSEAVTSVAFSPDGRRLASGGLDGAVILWSAAAPMP